MEEILGFMLIVALIILTIVVAVYIALGIFLNKFNKLVYGKGTPMAFIPIANIYLLGKLAVNKMVGICLIVGLFLTGEFSTTNIDGEVKSGTILPAQLHDIVSTLYGIAVLGLLIFAIVKYYKLKDLQVPMYGTPMPMNGVQPGQYPINNGNIMQPPPGVTPYPGMQNNPGQQQNNQNNNGQQ